MSSFEFPMPELGGRRRPIVPITIYFDDKSLKSEALVDSGADRCVFNTRVAQELGIDLSDAEKRQTIGIGGRIETRLKTIQLELCGKRITCKAAFSNLLTNYDVLGREPIFDEFDFHFKAREKKIVVTPV